MRFAMSSALLAATIATATAVGIAPAAATTFSNNLQPSYDGAYLSNIFSHDNACGCGPTDSSALVDAFTLATAGTVTTVKAGLAALPQNAVSDFTSFGDTEGYRVDIFSSLAAATANLVGDVYSKTFAPTAVGFGPGFSVGPADPYVVGTSFATFAVDATLAAGIYYLAVTGIDDPDLDESIGVAVGGVGNATLVNPGGDLGIPGNVLNSGENAAYAVSGTVPEPATWALFVAGFGLTGAMVRRRAVAAVAA